MHKISYARYRFPPVIIQHAVWLYFRFPLSYRDVEDLLAERGIDVSYETVRRWALKFGQAYARRLQDKRTPDQMPGGTLMRCSCPSPASECICGALSMVKAKCWISWFSHATTEHLQTKTRGADFPAPSRRVRNSAEVSGWVEIQTDALDEFKVMRRNGSGGCKVKISCVGFIRNIFVPFKPTAKVFQLKVRYGFGITRRLYQVVVCVVVWEECDASVGSLFHGSGEVPRIGSCRRLRYQRRERRGWSGKNGNRADFMLQPVRASPVAQAGVFDSLVFVEILGPVVECAGWVEEETEVAGYHINGGEFDRLGGHDNCCVSLKIIDRVRNKRYHVAARFNHHE